MQFIYYILYILLGLILQRLIWSIVCWNCSKSVTIHEFYKFPEKLIKINLKLQTKSIIWNLLTIKIAENLVVEIDNIDFL